MIMCGVNFKMLLKYQSWHFENNFIISNVFLSIKIYTEVCVILQRSINIIKLDTAFTKSELLSKNQGHIWNFIAHFNIGNDNEEL